MSREEEDDVGVAPGRGERSTVSVARDDGNGGEGGEGEEANEMEAGEKERGTDADGWVRAGSSETPAGQGSNGEVGLYEPLAPLTVSDDGEKAVSYTHLTLPTT